MFLVCVCVAGGGGDSVCYCLVGHLRVAITPKGTRVNPPFHLPPPIEQSPYRNRFVNTTEVEIAEIN